MPLSEVLPFKWETALWALLILAALVTRLWDLGARGMSHDDSLHALYSWKLYNGEGYAHDPMMHGPFLYHINALIYFLFGVSDYTARISVALFGTILVASPLLLRKWLGRTGALLTGLMFLISPVLLHYSRHLRHDMFACVWSLGMVIALFQFLDSHKDKWLYVGAAALTLSVSTKETAYLFGFSGLTFLLTAYLWEHLQPAQARVLFRLGGAMVAILLALVATLQFAGYPSLLQYAVLAAGFVAAVLIVGRLRGPGHQLADAVRAIRLRSLVNCLVLGAVIFSLLFTTFFTNPKGLITGVAGSVSYWLAQHGVQRGGQPWYYYLLLTLPLYEFLPSLFALGGLFYYLWHGATRPVAGTQSDAEPTPHNAALFISFAAYWGISSLLLYSWAGEKMPWLTTHLVLPLALLAGRFVGEVIDRADWPRIWALGGHLMALLLLPTLVALVTLFGIRPFQGMSLSKLNQTGQWLAALVMAGLLVYLVAIYTRRLGRRRVLEVTFGTLFVLLSLVTVRYAWMASFINYDYAKEFIFYAHGTPDVKLVMGEIESLSRRIAGDREIKVAYDDDSTWPLEWYLKDYPNRAYYGSEPTREALDAPVVIAGSKNDSKVRPFLGNRYYRFRKRLVWWPIEDYKDLTPARVWNILRDPSQRQRWWDIILYRRYDQSTAEWSPVHIFYLYVRKDVANQLWDYQVGPVLSTPIEESPYEKARLPLAAVRTWGTQGSGPGQFQDPRGVAIGPEGRIYVVDGGNHRVQVFDQEGRFLWEWGSQGSGPGQFQEPWGVAVALNGEVYVADTWNHRVQVFDPEARFLREWGSFAQAATATENEGQFWGPRDLAINAQGDIYVTDTGNKRVAKFTADGTFLGQWGGAGIEPVRMDEPVGIAVDRAGQIYVADTWNQRVQVFTGDFMPLAQWSVEGWFGQSVLNKPYLAVDDRSRVYVTDPEGYQVIAFEDDGSLLATFGQYGSDEQTFGLPIGIDVDEMGQIYVVDSGNHRIMQFAPVE